MITSTSNQKVKELIRLREKSKVRDEEGIFLVEGPRMVEEIRKELKFTTLKYHRLDDMMASTGVSPCKLCTYCWNGKE